MRLMCQVGDQQREQENRGRKTNPVQEGMNAVHLHCCIHSAQPSLPAKDAVALGYGFCDWLVAGDSVFAVFVPALRPATPTPIIRTIMIAATMPNIRTDLWPRLDPSSMSAITLLQFAIVYAVTWG